MQPSENNFQSRFRPCIDLHNGQVKQIVGSTLSDNNNDTLETNFVSSYPPKYYSNLYAKDNLKGGHVIMLGSGNEEAAISALNAYPNGLQVGGGIDDKNAQKYLDAGASAVIVTGYIFSDGKFKLDNLKKLSAMISPEKLVLDLSCRYCSDGRYRIVSDRWQRFTELELDVSTLEMLSSYSSEYLVHAVDVEGKQAGIDQQLLNILAEYSPVKCVYAGGISSFKDIDIIKTTGKGKIDYTIGSALDIFGGKISYDEVVLRDKNK